MSVCTTTTSDPFFRIVKRSLRRWPLSLARTSWRHCSGGKSSGAPPSGTKCPTMTGWTWDTRTRTTNSCFPLSGSDSSNRAETKRAKKCRTACCAAAVPWSQKLGAILAEREASHVVRVACAGNGSPKEIARKGVPAPIRMMRGTAEVARKGLHRGRVPLVIRGKGKAKADEQSPRGEQENEKGKRHAHFT